MLGNHRAIGEIIQEGMEFAFKQAAEEAASICEQLRPRGGRAWSDDQAACYNALSTAAKNIRELKAPKWN